MRARILAPKVESGKPFQVISTYWFTTFVRGNPFIGAPYCNQCHMPACFERDCGLLYGAVSVHEFACLQGHVWEYRQTHD